MCTRAFGGTRYLKGAEGAIFENPFDISKELQIEIHSKIKLDALGLKISKIV